MSVGVGLDAVAAAALAARLLAGGEPLSARWRHCVLQLLDDYEHDLRRSGADVARRRFSAEPERTESPQVDAALAALAEHLARRDGWPVPRWAQHPARYASTWWFVTPLAGMHATALQQSPAAFRKRGVFITADGLSRV